MGSEMCIRDRPPLELRRRPSQAVAPPGAQSTRALTSGAPPPMPFLAGPGPWRRRRPAQEFPRRRRRPTAPCPREPRRSRSRRPRRRTRTGRGARRPPTAPAPPPVVRAPRRRALADFAPAARSRPKRSRRSRRPCSAGAARGGTGRSTASTRRSSAYVSAIDVIQVGGALACVRSVRTGSVASVNNTSSKMPK